MGKRAVGWKVLIVDDDDQRREDLVSHTKKIPEIESVTAATSVTEGVATLHAERPNLVIVDLDAQPSSEVPILGRDARTAGVGVLLVTAGQDPSLLVQAMDWASGFLPREPTATTIGYAIQVVRTGAFYMESDQARGMVEELEALREMAERGPGSESLTPREKEVLALLSEGLSARQMARRLDLSERTINTHVANVYRKLAVSNRVQAVRQAIRLGLVQDPG
ncbi:MAG TPA: response regulator transcription factor [Actinomycetota bacterium]|nr:response regulator transcription factor [Actinomycetota bacterium]